MHFQYVYIHAYISNTCWRERSSMYTCMIFSTAKTHNVYLPKLTKLTSLIFQLYLPKLTMFIHAWYSNFIFQNSQCLYMHDIPIGQSIIAVFFLHQTATFIFKSGKCFVEYRSATRSILQHNVRRSISHSGNDRYYYRSTDGLDRFFPSHYQ